MIELLMVPGALGRLPARTCIGVTGLARSAPVEIDPLARKEEA
jgi:enamine deaminase RidA (YjgF/YER057c/UK114 family)